MLAPITPTMVLLLLLLLLLLTPAGGSITSESSALLTFYSGVIHAQRLQWNATVSPCRWRGVTCNSAGTTVTTVRLPGMGLVGPIPSGTISALSNLRVLSLRYNLLSGRIPLDIGNLTNLRRLYLQHNRFSGDVPAGVSMLRRLLHLDLSFNDLDGRIPVGFNELTGLERLFLQNNSFVGGISFINVPSLVLFNVSDNRLNGSIPAGLEKFPASSFAGNLGLCGRPLPKCNPSVSPTTQSGNRKHSLSTKVIIGISVVGGFLLLVIVALLICILLKRRRRRRPQRGKQTPPPPLPEKTAADKLTFMENSPYAFDLEDLLRASAEVLGKGTFGTSYKAVLEDGSSVVVKRLKDVAVGKREFDQQVENVGKVRHENILPLRAYYYSKDEKLLVYDYLSGGSLSGILHGSRPSSKAALDWSRRARLALAVARGILRLHSAGIFHGDVKSSNVILRPPAAAALSDAGLWVLFGKTPAPTEATDVYGFGMVVLEMLTGKPANQPVAAAEEETLDLGKWVRSVVSEEWTGEVFDEEVVKYGGAKAEEEMLQVLQLAMACVSEAPEKRPAIGEVVTFLEELVGKSERSDDPSNYTSTAPSPMVDAGAGAGTGAG